MGSTAFDSGKSNERPIPMHNVRVICFAIDTWGLVFPARRTGFSIGQFRPRGFCCRGPFDDDPPEASNVFTGLKLAASRGVRVSGVTGYRWRRRSLNSIIKFYRS